MVNMVLTSPKLQELYEPYIEMMQDLRQSQSRTQSDLSESAGLSPKYVTLIEGRKRTPSLDCFLALLAEVGLLRSTAERLVAEVLDRFEWKG